MTAHLHTTLARYHSNHSSSEMRADIMSAVATLKGNHRGRVALRDFDALISCREGAFGLDLQNTLALTTLFLAFFNGYASSVAGEIHPKNDTAS